MDMKLIGEVIGGIAAATLILCVLGGLTRKRWTSGTWALLLALAVAPVIADRYLPTNQWPTWRSSNDEQRVIVAIVPTALLALALAWKRIPVFVRALIVPAATAATLYWIRTGYPAAPPAEEWKVRLALPAGVALSLWLLIEPLAIRKPNGIAAPWICGCLAAGVGLLNLFSADTSPGWVAVAVGAVVGGSFLLALTGWGPSFAAGPVAVIVPVLVCLVMANRFNDPADVPWWEWAVMAAAPAVAWVVELRPMRNWRPWLREPLRMALVAIPVVIAVIPAQRRFAAEQKEQSGEAGWSMVTPSEPNGSAVGSPGVSLAFLPS